MYFLQLGWTDSSIWRINAAKEQKLLQKSVLFYLDVFDAP